MKLRMGREQERECLVMWVARKLEASEAGEREKVSGGGGGKEPPRLNSNPDAVRRSHQAL